MNELGTPDPEGLLVATFIAFVAAAWFAGFVLMLSEIEAGVRSQCRPRPAFWMYWLLLLVWPAELIARNTKRRWWK
jgi:hypothetical protein